MTLAIGMESFDPAVHPHACNLSQILLSVTSLPHTLDQSPSKCKSTDFYAIKSRHI